jgi:ankyrin repeat protein
VSRSFEEIRAAYADDPAAGGLDGPTARNGDGDTLLHLAALRGDEEDVRELVALGAVVNARGEFGMTALHHAAVAGRIDAAERLLALGADRLAPDDFGQTPAKLAAKAGHAEMAELLRPARRRGR